MTRNIPIETIVAYDNSPAALDLLAQYGINQPRSHKDLANSLRRIIVEDKENGFMAVATLHPDKEMILDLFGAEEKTHGFSGCSLCSMDGEKKMGCDGGCKCGGKCGGDKKLNATGEGSSMTKDDVKNMIAQTSKNENHTLLFGIAGLIIIAAILKS